MDMTERPDTGFPASAISPSDSLNCSLSLWNSLTIGFATISPGYQVLIWDASFTTSHIVAFYGTFQLYIACGIASYPYPQTWLPLDAQSTSFPLVVAVVGLMFILPNVRFNKWGHTSAPKHLNRHQCCIKTGLLMDPARKALYEFPHASGNLLSYGAKPEDLAMTERDVI
jgi:hypothetical protein